MANEHIDEKYEKISPALSAKQKDSFDREIEQILTNFNEKTADLTKLQTQIISLVKKYSQSDNVLVDAKDTEIDEKVIAKNISEASVYLMKQRENILKDNTTLVKKDDNFELTNNKSKEDFKRLVKGFAVYEIYKCMNPERIAGETQQDNFTHNLATGGIKKAEHYAGHDSTQNSTHQINTQNTTHSLAKPKKTTWER